MVNNTKKGKSKKAAVKAPIDQGATSSCCHGSTKEEFGGSGEYLDAVQEYFYRGQEQGQKQDNTTLQADAARMSKIFADDHIHLMKDSGFGNFVFAWCTREYLKSKLKKPVHRTSVKALLSMGLLVRYHYIPAGAGEDFGPGSVSMDNLTKLNRDIYTDRGIINCLARGTPCNCMDEGKNRRQENGKARILF